jgi:hypothetical protein
VAEDFSRLATIKYRCMVVSQHHPNCQHQPAVNQRAMEILRTLLRQILTDRFALTSPFTLMQ